MQLLRKSTDELFRELQFSVMSWPHLLDKYADLDKRLRILNDEVAQAQHDQFKYSLFCPGPQPANLGPHDAPLEHIPLFLSSSLLPEMAKADKQLAEAAGPDAASAAVEEPAHKKIKLHNDQVQDLLELFQDEAAPLRERLRKRRLD